MMAAYKGMNFFTSSPLSAPPSSPRKRMQGTTTFNRSPIAESSEGDDNSDEDDEDTQRPGHASTTTGNENSNVEDEYEVEAIVARKGGYNGKTLMYKVRWKGWGPESDTWEPRSNISADDMIRAFEARKPRPVKRHKRTESKGHAQSLRTDPSPSSSIYNAPSSERRVTKPKRMTRDKEAKTLFWQSLPYDADELVFPVSSLICDASWSKLRIRTESTASMPEGSRKLIVIHPATLVRLRTQTSSSQLNAYFRAALKVSVQLIRETQYAMLSNASFPAKSIFYDRAPYDILVGGEPYRLSWDTGIEEPDQEFYHLLATLQTLPGKLDRHRRCTLLVRRVHPEMKRACDYFGVNILDANTFFNNT